jgi:hypothetical protein
LQRSPHNCQGSSNEHGALIQAASPCLEHVINVGEDGPVAVDVSRSAEVVSRWMKSTHVAERYVSILLDESRSGLNMVELTNVVR